MTSLHALKPPRNSRHRKKRVGRGQGSGLGKTAGRGGKGQKARTGNMHFEGFEGGQMPLQRRLPKFGFTSPNRVEYAVVNVSELERFENGASVGPEELRAAGLVKGRADGVKVLGKGTVGKKLRVRAHKFSGSARELIQRAGGTAEELPLRAHKPESASRAHAGKGVKPAPANG
ncbi:MAG TPA: 50S ribosomal protein L15 [Myxococcaceae bacterium]|nr:50S ribosomal protein L15 [Myxococcaceae bacterium]